MKTFCVVVSVLRHTHSHTHTPSSSLYTDVIMDMLGNQRMRQLITDYYQCSDEPKLVNLAVKQAWSRERKYSLDIMDGNEGEGTSLWAQIKYVHLL